MEYGPTPIIIKLLVLFSLAQPLIASLDTPLYDFTAYTECKAKPERALYNGGIIKLQEPETIMSSTAIYSPAFLLQNLSQSTIYSFSSWVKIESGSVRSSLIRASLKTENDTLNCIGNVLAKTGCWSFLKGGFTLHLPSNLSILYFENSNNVDIRIAIASYSLQPFSDQQWRTNQQYIISTKRKRAVTIHVSNLQGERLEGAMVTVQQVSKDFPFGSAIAKTILGNLPYQEWFVKRFNAAVFENELKWYATEPRQGEVNYTMADQMLEFVRAHQIIARGHNIFWEDPKYTPQWVRDLSSSSELRSAVTSRIRSLTGRYKDEFVHWDVSNEMLHFDFYEKKLGREATLGFFEAAHGSDPLATLFMNEFNVVETCSDEASAADSYVDRVKELRDGGVFMDGVGLEGHFSVPNLALIRAVVDKLATLGLPIWLTEVDISNTLDKNAQAIYLEQVLREGFSHPSINGIMLWTALHPNGCYQMCLTDNNLKNLPAGDVVDKLLKEWETEYLEGLTDDHGSFSFFGFLGQYKIIAKFGNTTLTSTLSLPQGDETKHFSIQL